MDKEQFYRRVAKAAGRSLSKFEIEMLDYSFESTYYKTEFIALEDVQYRLSEKNIGYWLYDKKSKTWIINVILGYHSVIMATLHGIYKNSDDLISMDTAAELYVTELYGFYVSGAMNQYIPIKDDRYVFSDDESIFEHAKGKLAWRGV